MAPEIEIPYSRDKIINWANNKTRRGEGKVAVRYRSITYLPEDVVYEINGEPLVVYTDYTTTTTGQDKILASDKVLGELKLAGVIQTEAEVVES